MPYDPSDTLPNFIDQSDSDSETLDHAPPVYVPEGGNHAAQPNEDDLSVSINATEGAHLNISFVELDDTPVAFDSASFADFYNHDEPDLNIYAKAKKFGNTNLVVYTELTKFPVLLDISK